MDWVKIKDGKSYDDLVGREISSCNSIIYKRYPKATLRLGLSKPAYIEIPILKFFNLENLGFI